MHTVNITIPTEVSLNNNTATIQPGSYTVDDLTFCKENDFMKCGRCREWFDEVHSVSQYHPKFNERKQLYYCGTCFDLKYD